MFKITDRILTPNGAGVIIELKKSSYSKSISFYVVDLDSGFKGYLCPVYSAKELK